MADAIRVNGVKVSAGRLGDAEKSSVKVIAFYCCITGRLAALSQEHTTQSSAQLLAGFHFISEVR